MANTLPPFPLQDAKDLPYTLTEWFRQLQRLVGGAVGSIPWSSVNKAGSDIVDLASHKHNDLTNFQGGSANQYYHNTAAVDAIVSVVANSTYTPTLTNTTNISASTAYVCQYVRLGTMVMVSGKVDVDPTAAGQTVLGISLPIASNLANEQNLGGTAFCKDVAGEGAAIYGDATNDRATMEWIAVDTANRSRYFSFMYRVI